MESFNIDVFATRLKTLREEKKKTNSQLTQDYVAKLIGVARSTYTSYENGTKQPPLENVYSIAKLFNCTTDYLLGRSEDKAKMEQDYLKSIIKKQVSIDDFSLGNGEKIYDLEQLLNFLKDKELSWGDEILEGEEKRRAIEVLKALFGANKGKD